METTAQPLEPPANKHAVTRSAALPIGARKPVEALKIPKGTASLAPKRLPVHELPPGLVSELLPVKVVRPEGAKDRGPAIASQRHLSQHFSDFDGLPVRPAHPPPLERI